MFNATNGNDGGVNQDRKVYDAGTYWKWPMIETPIVYSLAKRSQTFQHKDFDAKLSTSDGVNVQLTTRVEYRAMKEQLHRIYQRVPTYRNLDPDDTFETVLPLLAEQSAKQVLSQYAAGEVQQSRDIIREQCEQQMQQLAAPFGLEVCLLGIMEMDTGTASSLVQSDAWWSLLGWRK